MYKSNANVVGTVQSLGFEVNWSKVVKPSKVITFLGIQIDTDTLQLSIPVPKLQEIKEKVSKWLVKRKATKRELQSLAGSISWAAKCIKAVRPILRNIIDLFKGLRNAKHHVRLPAFLKSDVRYLLQWCETFQWRGLWPDQSLSARHHLLYRCIFSCCRRRIRLRFHVRGLVGGPPSLFKS